MRVHVLFQHKLSTDGNHNKPKLNLPIEIQSFYNLDIRY